MSNTKIEGKFYPLQHKEWLHACQVLTPTQLNVLYLVRCLDPYGHGIETSPTAIARQLSGGDKQVHRSTISRALKVLKEKDFIEVEPVVNNTKVKAKGIHYCHQPEEEETVVVSEVVEKTSGIQNNEFDSDSVALSEDNKCDPETTGAIATQPARSRCNTAVLEPPSEKDSEPYKNIKTIKTLSENEREKFLEFAMSKVGDLPNRPALPRKWIEVNFNELYEQFCDKNKPTETSQAWERWQKELEQRRIQAEQTYQDQLPQEQTGDPQSSEKSIPESFENQDQSLTTPKRSPQQVWQDWQDELERRRTQAQQAYRDQLAQEQTENPQSSEKSPPDDCVSSDQPPKTPKRNPQQAWQDWQDELEQRRIQAQQTHPEQLTQEQTIATSKSTSVDSTDPFSPSVRQSLPSRFPGSQKPGSSLSHSKTTRLGTDTFEQLNDIWHDNG